MQQPEMEGIKCVLLDIEGTVCPISFVKDTLFPYAIKALPNVLASEWDDGDFASYRDAFPEEHRASPTALQAHVEDLTKRDVKAAYLKNLQGMLWEDGYKSGAYSTPLFPDVTPRLRKWKEGGLDLAIYSSGSVFAQKLLFAHVQAAETSDPASRKRGRPSEGPESHAEDDRARSDKPPVKKQAVADDSRGDVEQPKVGGVSSLGGDSAALSGGEVAASGDQADKRPADTVTSADDGNPSLVQPPGTMDMTGLFSGWYDTTNAGLKTEAASYLKIADGLKHNAKEILFLSDNVKEVDAAIAAKMKSILVDRRGNAPVAAADRERLRVVDSLVEIDLHFTSASEEE